jgi:hypothetical protein
VALSGTFRIDPPGSGLSSGTSSLADLAGVRDIRSGQLRVEQRDNVFQSRRHAGPRVRLHPQLRAGRSGFGVRRLVELGWRNHTGRLDSGRRGAVERLDRRRRPGAEHLGAFWPWRRGNRARPWTAEERRRGSGRCRSSDRVTRDGTSQATAKLSASGRGGGVPLLPPRRAASESDMLAISINRSNAAAIRSRIGLPSPTPYE